MTDFSQPTTYDAPLIDEKKRKEQFVDRLRGNAKVRVVPSVTVGVVFTICNTATQEIHTVLKHDTDSWWLYGTSGVTTQLTNADLAYYLTEQAKIANKLEKDLRISDEYGCLEWLG